jgi:hypothetical protein
VLPAFLGAGSNGNFLQDFTGPADGGSPQISAAKVQTDRILSHERGMITKVEKEVTVLDSKGLLGR